MGVPLALPDLTLIVVTPLSGGTTLSLNPYGSRAITQSLEVIPGSGTQGQWLRRDVNGFMRNFSDARFRKYRSTIACRDSQSPNIDGSWLGEICDVECAVELSYPTGGSPQRPAVAGSTRTELSPDGSKSFTYYRPQLTMMVAGIKTSFSEWSALYSWELTLEEF